MTQEELDRINKENATIITPDEQERYGDAMDVLDEIMDMVKADGKKMIYHALYSVWLELDGLMADWKCRMDRRDREKEKNAGDM